MKTGFAQPILGCRVIVQLAIVGIGRFVHVEVLKSAVIAEVNLVVVIDHDSTRANRLMGQTSVVKIR